MGTAELVPSSHARCAAPPGGTRGEAGGVRGWEKSQNVPTEKGIFLGTKWLPEPEGSSKCGSPR